MTDPNLRRLLEIAAQKQMDGDTSCKHYAILKKDKIEDSATSEGLSNFEKVNAHIDAKSICPIVPTKLTRRLLYTYLLNGTHKFAAKVKRFLIFSIVGR